MDSVQQVLKLDMASTEAAGAMRSVGYHGSCEYRSLKLAVNRIEIRRSAVHSLATNSNFARSYCSQVEYCEYLESCHNRVYRQ